MHRKSIFYGFLIALSGGLLFSCCNDPATPRGVRPGTNKNEMSQKIEIGSAAPPFSLPDQSGRRVNLIDYFGKSNVVLYFYPRDESFGCTREACSFRDHYETFKEAGAVVIGISSDDIASHQAFTANHKLPFLLLSDRDKTVAEKYGVSKSLGSLPGRVTFIIDRKGIVRMIYSSQLNFEKHVSEAMEAVKRLH